MYILRAGICKALANLLFNAGVFLRVAAITGVDDADLFCGGRLVLLRQRGHLRTAGDNSCTRAPVMVY